ncbi:glycosyltransferase family 4 protein [Dysgonomonas mossii]|uniref:glycosyltransferase family 4 protein n=1 Tax=Dysgonomonas mossii TaxID=163665 RepID=UPI0039939DFE
MNKALFIVVNVDWFFLSHRLPIALAAKEKGYRVTIVSKDTGKREEIEALGLRFINVEFERSGANPLHELRCIKILYKIYKLEKPDIIHHVTLKASLLGCLAAKLSGIKRVVNAISGFGYNFTDERTGIKQRIIRTMMNMAFKSKKFHFIFQNPDDINQFMKFNFVSESQIHLIKGSGVDLNKFTYEKPISKEKVQVILPARMLYDKGIIEFIQAAKKIKDKVVDKAEFVLVGDCDTINLSGIKEEDIKREIDVPFLNWIGFKKDIFSVIKNSDIVVLPSYREGLPKSLIEACAVGRPIVTTDVEGCRECVIEGYNGYLVPAKNIETLSEKMEDLINDPEKRTRMGLNGRILAEKNFSIDFVIREHLRIYKDLES